MHFVQTHQCIVTIYVTLLLSNYLYIEIIKNIVIVWETAVHLAVAGGVFDGVFCVVLFPTRCLG